MGVRQPTVSIITASYNHAAYVGAALESVQRQGYDAWELLVADDASTDQTLEVLASYAQDARIRVFPFRVNREYHMRNFAAGQARGDYLAFLNSDDVFLPGKLQRQVELLQANPQVAAVFTHVQCVDEKGRQRAGHDLERVFAVDNRTRLQWLRRFFLAGNCLCISSAMVRRECFQDVGGFNPLLIQIADLDLWIRLCLKWDLHVIPEPLTAMRWLSGRRNLSAAGSATSSRAMVEYPQAYDHYFSAEGLDLMPAIFPELAVLSPEDPPSRRCYLLSRRATTLPSKAARLLGFRKLHELLRERAVRESLLRRNPRLLRALFLSEGVAALDKDSPGLLWTLRLPAAESSEPAGVFTFWTAAVDGGTVCFSIPNPGLSCRLPVTLEARSLTVKCRRLRLYDQQTGTVIFDGSGGRGFQRKAVTSGRTGAGTLSGPGTRRWKKAWNFCLPELDFAAFMSNEIDIEAEIEVPVPGRRIRGWLRDAKRWWRRMWPKGDR